MEKEEVENIMQGVKLSTLGNIGGLLTSILAFIVLVVGFNFVNDKRPMRSDYMYYFLIVNIVLLIGVWVSWYYTTSQEIPVSA